MAFSTINSNDVFEPTSRDKINANFGQAVDKDGSVPFTGNQSMGNNRLTSVLDPSSAQDVATKNYVDNPTGDITFLNTKGVVFKNAAGSADGSIKEDASNNIAIIPGSSGIISLARSSVATKLRVYDGAASPTRYIELGSDGVNQQIKGGAGGNLQMVSFTGTTDFVVSGANSKIRVYDSATSKYTELTHDGTNGYINVSSGQLYIQQHFIPQVDNTYDLGIASTNRFRNSYVVSSLSAKNVFRWLDGTFDFLGNLPRTIEYAYKTDHEQRRWVGIVGDDLPEMAFKDGATTALAVAAYAIGAVKQLNARFKQLSQGAHS